MPDTDQTTTDLDRLAHQLVLAEGQRDRWRERALAAEPVLHELGARSDSDGTWQYPAGQQPETPVDEDGLPVVWRIVADITADLDIETRNRLFDPFADTVLDADDNALVYAGLPAPWPATVPHRPQPAPVGRAPALDLDEIETRADHYRSLCHQIGDAGAPDLRNSAYACADDVMPLVDEVRRLRAELEQAASDRDHWSEATGQAAQRHLDEVDRLESVEQELTAALELERETGVAGRRVWAAALQYAAGRIDMELGQDRGWEVYEAVSVWASQIESGALSPWAQEAPVDRSHLAAAGPNAADPPSGTPAARCGWCGRVDESDCPLHGTQAPAPAGDGHGLILGRAWMDRDGDAWHPGPDDGRWVNGGYGETDRAEVEARYGPVRPVLLVASSAGPILERAVEWARQRRLVGYKPDGSPLAAAVAAATGNQPDGEMLADWERELLTRDAKQRAEAAADPARAEVDRLRQALDEVKQQQTDAVSDTESVSDTVQVLVTVDGRCGCCAGHGEHPCSHECDSCDGSGREPDSPPCTMPHGADCRCVVVSACQADTTQPGVADALAAVGRAAARLMADAPEPAECETCGRNDLAQASPPRCTRHVDVPPTLAELAASFRHAAGDPDGDPDDQPGPEEAADWTALADLVEATRGTVVVDSSLYDAARRLADGLETAHARTIAEQDAVHQIATLAEWIATHVPGEPSRSEGAVETAIRLLGQPAPVPAGDGPGWDRDLVDELIVAMVVALDGSAPASSTADIEVRRDDVRQLRALLADRDRLARELQSALSSSYAEQARLVRERDTARAELDSWRTRAELAESRLDGQAWEDLTAERDRLLAEHRRFAEELGFGDGASETAASLADMLDPVKEAMSAAADHDDCPVHCELCGETLAATVCQRCNGLGDIGSGAYSECPECAGVGRIHEGCAEASYADLARECGKVAELRGLASRLATGLTLTMPYWRTPGEQIGLGRLLADARRAGLLGTEAGDAT